ncbi:T9SS type A sorting domain-containing protein [Ekhidna sp.]
MASPAHFPLGLIATVLAQSRFIVNKSRLILLIVLLSSNSIFSQVLINEVVTDPQQDWSANGFDGTIGGVTVTQGTDEWIELYITANGLDLTGWTIEVTDGGFFSGDLTSRDATSTGAFQESVYFGSGSFTNTQAGDYLVLGNPLSSESMTNDVFIVLRDNTSAIVDDLEIGDDVEGDGDGDGAHDGTASGGDASGIDDESVARIANGTDTDNDLNDFQQVRSTLGSENGLANVFVDASVANDDGLGIASEPKQFIQSGIDLALTGGTISVVQGTYAESISITKSLTLNGANQGIAASGSRGTEAIIEPGSNNVGITITSDDVTVDGFQFGTNSTTSNITTGISSDGNTGLSIQNNVINANGVGISINNASSGSILVDDNLVAMINLEDPLNAAVASIGILTQNLTGTTDADFTNNDVQTASYGFFGYNISSSTTGVISGGSYTACTKGIEINNTDGLGNFNPSTVDIQNVTMSGFTGPDADLAQPDTQAGIYAFVTGNATATDDLIISMDNIDISGIGNGNTDYAAIYMADFQAAGPFDGSDDDGIAITATLSNSNIHDNLNRGIYSRGRNAITTVSQTSITSNGSNPFSSGAGGVVFARGTLNISNCTIINPGSGTVDALLAQSSGIISASDNSFDQNGNGDLAEIQSGGTIDLSSNWLGTTTQTTIEGLVDLTGVDFTPWLADGTDTDLVTSGFQGDFSSLIVGAAGTQTGSSGRISEGITLVSASGTVTVNAGTYSENLSIGKSVTLNGANQGTAGSGTRLAESIIEPGSANVGILVGAADVTIDGFQFGADNASSNHSTAISNTGFAGLTASNNVIFANSAGIAISGITSGSLTISSNAIEMLNLEDPLNATNPSFGINAQNITGTTNADFSSNDIQTASYGFFGYNLNATPTVSIDGGIYTGCVKGIEIDNTDGVGFNPSTASISNVTMSGFVNPDADVASPDAQAGIYSFVSGSATSADDITLVISGVDISGVGNAASDYSGIYLGDFTDDDVSIDYTITDSNIHDNLNRGIFVRGEDATANVSTSTITGNGFDPRGTGGNPGFSIIARNGGTAIVDQCVITNAATQSNFTTTGLHASVGGSITVSNSSITNNGNGTIAQGITGSTMNLSANWLGSSDEITIQSFLSSSTLIDITPWLNDGTDSDGVSVGFQGDFDAITVTTFGTQTGGASDRLQEGHDLVNTDGSITILQDDYAETLTVSKNVGINPQAGTTIDDVTLNGGDFSVLSNLEINSILTLTSGILDIDLDDGDKSDDPTLTLNSVVAGSFNASNHIEGKMEVAIGAAGFYTFPAGDEGAYRPVTLTPTNATTFSVSHIAETTPVGGGTFGDVRDLHGTASAELTGNIESTLDFRYWGIDVVAGTPGNTNVAIEIDGGDNATDASTMGILRFDGTDWQELSLVGAAGTDPFVITAQTSTFSEFTIYSTDSDANPLPVELIDFSGEMENRLVRLVWSTLSESNSEYFQIERLNQEGTEFVSMGKISSQGTSNIRIDYQFTDVANQTGKLYYRLKMVDFDGSFEYSSTIIVLPDLSDISIKVYPNPATDFIQIQGIEEGYFKKAVFYDLKGKLHRSIDSMEQNLLPVSDLSEGHYLIRVELVDGSVYQGKVVKD